jgi:maltose phosphorylase
LVLPSGTKELISLKIKKYVILGVTGPEYENNVIIISIPTLSKWCIDYTYAQKVSMEFPSDHKRIIEKTKLAESELKMEKGSR